MALTQEALKRALLAQQSQTGSVTGPAPVPSTATGSVTGPAPVPERMSITSAPAPTDGAIDWDLVRRTKEANPDADWEGLYRQTQQAAAPTQQRLATGSGGQQFTNWAEVDRQAAADPNIDWQALRNMLNITQVDQPYRNTNQMTLSDIEPVRLEQWGLPVGQDLNQQARDAVQLQYGEALRGLEGAERDAVGQYLQLVDEQRLYGREADPRLENIYSALQTSLGQNKANNQETYQDAISQIRAWYDQAHGDSADLNQSILDRMNTDAQRLGIEAAIPAGTQDLNNDYQYNQMQNRMSQAGRSANLLELAANIGALDENRIGAAAREGAQQRATLANEIARTIGQLGVEHYSELADLRSESAGLQGEMGAAVRDELANRQQRQFENVQTARGNALDEMLSRAGLDLQRAGFNRGNYEADRNFDLALQELGLSREQLALQGRELDANIEGQQADNALKWAQLDAERQRLSQEQSNWEREFAEATSPEAKARAQAELDRIRAETDALNAEANSPEAMGTGYTGLLNYINQRKPNQQSKTVAKAIIDNVRRQISGTTNPNGMGSPIPLAGEGAEVDAYTLALNNLDQYNRLDGPTKRMVTEMLTVYYGTPAA